MPTDIANSGLEADMLSLFLYMGSEWVLYLLMILSVISIAITFERLVHFFQHRADAEALYKGFEHQLETNGIDGAKTLLESSRSHVARIALSGLNAIGRGTKSVEEVVAGATQLQKLQMERGLAFLGTLGNNAPFVGLFGTVLGIIRAFRDLATNTVEGSQAVMAGIAEALVATAVGLLVALPAVAMFNIFQRRIRTEIATSDAVTRVLLAHMKSDNA